MKSKDRETVTERQVHTERDIGRDRETNAERERECYRDRDKEKNMIEMLWGQSPLISLLLLLLFQHCLYSC